MVGGNLLNSNIPQIEWNWDDVDYNPAWHDPIVELLSRYIRAGSRILEVGAGGSHTLGALAARLDCHAIGIEPDEDGIRKTIDLANDGAVKMIRGDGFCLPFPDELFDVVYSLGLVEHFEYKDTEALIGEHFRVCRPGGTVIVGVPNLLNLPHSLRKAHLGKRYEYFPERSFTPWKLRKMLAKSGLKSITLDGLNSLWGLGMSPTGWRIVTILKRLGIEPLLHRIGSPAARACLGYMTYAIGRKEVNG
jgi:SAM-dependent methyltransferase